MAHEFNHSNLHPKLLPLTPSHRFRRVREMVIHSHLQHPRLLSHRSIKVLSWNIAKRNQQLQWQHDFQSLLTLQQPDLVFLQEVKLCANTQQMPSLESLNWQFVPNFIDGYTLTYAGILTAAKAMHLETQPLLSQDCEPITNTPKVSLLSRYALPGSSTCLLAVNTHIINFVELKAFRAQLQTLAAAITAHRGPVILSGDFNTWSQSRWQILSEITRQLQLKPVGFHPEDRLKIKRFLLSPPLDHIFYRDLTPQPISAKVLDHISSSDHKPICVELAWD
jgi:endonuclease/exonuclease/phosphatase (EEP) superfamily protein YafD